MRINRFQDENHQHLTDRQQAFALLLDQPSDQEKRPCSTCDVPCPCSRSATCSCACSAACPLVPQALSSDPDRYPIEAGIVPLIYQLNVLRVVQPCWSCEGHEDDQHSLLKLPQVWFYSPSVVFPQLLAEAVHTQKFHKIIAHDWDVSVCVQDYGEFSTTFVLKPHIDLGIHHILQGLRQDVKHLSLTLRDTVRRRAAECYRMISQRLRDSRPS